MKTKKRVEQAVKHLESIREAKDMSLEQFANNELGVTRQTYVNWVDGRHEPDLEKWFKIQDYLEG